MTTALLLLLSVGLILLVLARFWTGKTPDDNREKDGTYSTHNYKQPNKAAIARQWETPLGVAVPPIKATQPLTADYKHHSGPDTGAGLLTGPASTPATSTDRHYKTQHWLQNDPKAANRAKNATEDQPAPDE